MFCVSPLRQRNASVEEESILALGGDPSMLSTAHLSLLIPCSPALLPPRRAVRTSFKKGRGLNRLVRVSGGAAF